MKHTIDRRAFLLATAAVATTLTLPVAACAGLAPRPAVMNWRARKRMIEVLDTTMAVVDSGPPPPTAAVPTATAVFLHGNPTSSYLWRNILPRVSGECRCVAPDLIGMGDSAKLSTGFRPPTYRFADHSRYLDALLDQLALGDQVLLVLHDWGGMLGFDWARRHASRVWGIAHMETVMEGLSTRTAPAAAINFFRRYHTDEGSRAVLEQNQFVEQVLFGSLPTELTDADRAEYRRPFLTPGEGRRPTLTWPREMPIDNDPADTAARFEANRSWLAASAAPKLFLNVEPGALVASPGRKAICRSWPNTTEVTVRGGHFVQEQAPEAITEALLSFLKR
jgi:haloalkane dehalogenase